MLLGIDDMTVTEEGRVYCCMTFRHMIDDSHIQQNDDGNYIIWTCTGNVGEYPMYDDPDCDGINFCPWCGNKLPIIVSTDP